MTTHLGLMILLAFFVAVVFSALMRDDPREQVTLGARLFGAFVASAIVLGWLMFPLPL